MRAADTLSLALAALWQQKARTCLTTLGVVFGSFVLAASLSVGQGVQDLIQRQSRRNTHLREIQVYSNWQPRPVAVPTEEVKITGNLSASRRQRLRKALVQRRNGSNASGPRVPLTRQRLDGLRAIDHVEQVLPNVQLAGWALLGSHSQPASMISTGLPNDSLRKRVGAGRFFETPAERSALVSELLLYQLGITDETALAGAVGQRLRLEFRSELSGTGLALYLTKPDGAGMSREEAAALDKIKRQLPLSLDRFDLDPVERQSLQAALAAQPAQALTKYFEDVTIVGVLSLPGNGEPTSYWDTAEEDVILPVATAQEFFFRAPLPSGRGVERATLVVDNERNVKEVMKRVEAHELNAYAPLEFIERERLLYLLIFGSMTCVAGVALLVAALGIANTMLMSVLERTREVGIMKAVGAGNGQIVLIFLVEGMLIGLVGGGLGLALGWAASIPGDSWVRSMVHRDLQVDLKETLFVFPLWLQLTVVLFAVVVTTLAAVYPARRAARVNPVTALRHE